MRLLTLGALLFLLAAQTGESLFAPPDSEKAWAVVVGISRFQELEEKKWLEHADADGAAFARFITSRQGLKFRDDHVITLLNEQATAAAIITTIYTKLPPKVKAGDSVYLFFASHGFVETVDPYDPYLVAYNTKNDELAATAVSFLHLEQEIERRLAKKARVMIITDACHSGKMVEARTFYQRTKDHPPEVFGLLASAGEESSLESKDFGGGHGAFTYQLLRGLQGEADTNGDGAVSFSEASAYLARSVPQVTAGRQHPQPFGKPPVDYALSLVNELRADLGFTGPPAVQTAELVVSAAPGTEVFVNGARRGQVGDEGKLAVDRFKPDNYRVMAVTAKGERAVQEILVSGDPTEVRFDGKALWTEPVRLAARQRDLDVSDQDAAQQILLAYLKGNAVRLSPADFDRCAELYGKARSDAAIPDEIQARQSFCAGRAAIERRDFARAAPLIEESIRLEPKGGYHYNARGLLKLAQNDFRGAVGDFDLAAARAPRWPYPHFNAALAWTSIGQTARAEQEYQRAIALGPRYAYLHYNLATLYTRINQPARAEQEYRRAIELDLDPAAGHNALGLFFRSRNRQREAETEFRRALQFFDGDVAARVNLARLYRDQRTPQRAEQELLAGLRRIESPLLHTALGDLYTELRRNQEAAAEYRRAAELEGRP